MKKHLLLVAIAGSLALAGCGGGGGGGSSSGSAAVTPTVVSGIAAKGIIAGAEVLVCRVKNGVPDAAASCTTGTTGNDGSYSVTLTDGWTGPVVVNIVGVVGSSMYNEVTGATNDAYAMTMRAVVPAVTATTIVYVTPFSEMAAAAVGNTGVTAASIQTAVSTVQTSLGVDLSVKPVVDLKNDGNDAATLGQEVSLVAQLAKVLQAATDGTTGIKDATGAFCAANSKPVACAVTAMAGVMTAPGSLNSTTAPAVLTAWNSEIVTTMTLPVITAAGTVTTEAADVTSAASIQTALTGAGMATADATAASTQIQTITNVSSSNSTTLVGNVQTAATTASGGTITVTPPATTTLSALAQAKSMVAQLRTTFNYYSNTAGTGFLDTQKQQLATNLNSIVWPNLSNIELRIKVMNDALRLYDDVQAGEAGVTPVSYQLGTNTSTSPATSYYFQTSFANANYNISCYTNTFPVGTANPTITKVYCDAIPGAFGIAPGAFGIAALQPIRVSLIPSGTPNSFSYYALDRAETISSNGSIAFPLASGPYNYDSTTNANTLDATCTPASTTSSSVASTQTSSGSFTTTCTAYVGNGTVSKTFDASGNLTGLALSGTLPPSSSSNTSGIGYDTVTLSASSALQSGNTYQVSLSGLVVSMETATTSTGVTPDPNNAVSLSLNSGSYIEEVQTAATASAPATYTPTAVNVSGTFKMADATFNGTLVAGSFMKDAAGRNYAPTSIVFNGSISDTSAGGAGQFLTGKLDVEAPNYASYDDTKPTSAQNYIPITGTFTGQVTAPNEPIMQLVLAGSNGYAASGDQSVSLTLTYTYGTGISITGTGTFDTVTKTGNITLTNQDGIKIVLKTNTDTSMTASDGTNLATIKSGGMVYYTDGTFDSLL